MKQGLSVCLFILLLCHTLAYVIAGLGAWWQDKHDLSERLLVYRTVDSIVEFQIPLTNQTDGTTIARTTEDGFAHRGHYFEVVSLDIRDDTLHIAGLESAKYTLWPDDLLTFLTNHLTRSPDTGRKSSRLLKFLLKEYSPNPRTVLRFRFNPLQQLGRVPPAVVVFCTRSVPVHSPPPEPIG